MTNSNIMLLFLAKQTWFHASACHLIPLLEIMIPKVRQPPQQSILQSSPASYCMTTSKVGLLGMLLGVSFCLWCSLSMNELGVELRYFLLCLHARLVLMCTVGCNSILGGTALCRSDHTPNSDHTSNRGHPTTDLQ